MAEHIQLRRTRRWRLPAGAVVAEDGPLAVDRFRQLLKERSDDPGLAARRPYPSDEQIRADLAGRDLACWCPLPVRTRAEVAAIAAPLGIAVPEHIDPCHGDVLLRVGGAP